ncbi:MAG TPA: hypothetical protein ENI61_01830 [Ignavibacteria bacterium]|nr:hypothetical protein [Ignavibacteria bacterium]
MQQEIPETKLLPETIWLQFKQYFWVLFVLHLLTKVLPSLPPEGISNPENYQTLLIANLIFGIIIAILMTVNVGWNAYRLSKKKKYILFGFLGLIWFNLVGIFIAYFIVEWIFYNSIEKKFPMLRKIIVGTLSVIALLLILSVALVTFNTYR